MITNYSRTVPRFGGGALPFFTFPQRGIGSAIYREIARFALSVCQRARFALER